MDKLKVEVVENGFVVSEGDSGLPFYGRRWVFENSSALGDFIDSWGEEKFKDKPKPGQVTYTGGL